MVKMTTAEYKAKYGVAPVVSDSFDTTPAVRKMTRSEYIAQYGITPEQKSTYSPEQYNIGKNYREGKINFGDVAIQGLGTAARDVNQEVFGSSFLPVNPGGPRFIPNPVGMALNAMGSVADALGGIVKPVADLFGIGVGKTLRTIIGAKTADEMGKQVESVLTHPATQALVKDFSSPKVKGDLMAVKDIAELALMIVGASETAKGLGNLPKAVEAPKPPGPDGTGSTKGGILRPIVDKFKSKADAKTIAAREEQIFQIENNYAKTRKAMDYSKDEGASSRRRIASTDVLVNSVDENGIIRTKQKGGAVDQYKKQTIDGYEGVVRENLAREGKTVNLAEVQKELIKQVDRSGLEGADLQTALNGIRKEIAGLRHRANEFGDVEVAKIHDAKINTTKNINYQTPPEIATYRKSVARAYKNVVESKSDIPKQVNPELTKFYKDIELLENLDGKRVKGGKLGKYFAQITGQIVGGAAGGTVGGFPGVVVGSVVGGEVSAALKGRTMSKTFGKNMGIEAPKSAILEKAKETGLLPKDINLTKPDPRVGANQNILKTKDILVAEGKIKANVDAQKKAILAKEFTLVAKLKEAYTILVEELKAAIKKSTSALEGKSSKR